MHVTTAAPSTCGATGLVYLNNRYHDPELGRFISVDPLVDMTRDVYGYGNNNPIRYSDPTGLCASTPAEGAACFGTPAIYAQGNQMAADGAGQSEIAGYYMSQPSINKPGTHYSQLAGLAYNALWRTAPGAYKPPVRQLGYNYRWKLFAGTPEDAAALFARFRANPGLYFPFQVNVASCGGDCSVPISEGNVLALAGDEHSYVIGDVSVESAGGNSFRFLALPGQDREGGTIEFRIFEEDGHVYLQNIAVVVPGSSEALVPTATEFAGKSLWALMAAAFRCEHAYAGQEQHRRC